MITARKFKSRIDYVDLTIYGVGQKFDDKDKFAEKSQAIENKISQYTSHYGRLNHRLKCINDYLREYEFRISAMATRYDERMKNIIQDEKFDMFQQDIIQKMHDRKMYRLRQK